MVEIPASSKPAMKTHHSVGFLFRWLGWQQQYVLAAGLLGVLSGAPAARSADLRPVLGVDWLPGDCDQNGKLGVADAVRMVQHLFLGNASVVCTPLCDANGDLRVDAGDPVYLLNYLFVSPFLQPYVHDPLEICDRLDNDCDDIVDEECRATPQASVTLSWDAVTRDVDGGREEVWGYRVHHGTAPGVYTHYRQAGKETTYEVTGLEARKTYYFAVSVYDLAGNESELSAPVEAVAQARQE